MRKKEPPVGGRTGEMVKSGVKVVACENTMKGLNLSKAEMLTTIGYVPAGVTELMRKQEEGWACMRPWGRRLLTASCGGLCHCGLDPQSRWRASDPWQSGLRLPKFAKRTYTRGMGTMNISLPESLRAFVEDQVSERGYGTSSEYVRELIRRDQDRLHLRGLLLVGVSSPAMEPVDQTYFDRLRSRVGKRRPGRK